jgi:hypothetical protein
MAFAGALWQSEARKKWVSRGSPFSLRSEWTVVSQFSDFSHPWLIGLRVLEYIAVRLEQRPGLLPQERSPGTRVEPHAPLAVGLERSIPDPGFYIEPCLNIRICSGNLMSFVLRTLLAPVVASNAPSEAGTGRQDIRSRWSGSRNFLC